MNERQPRPGRRLLTPEEVEALLNARPDEQAHSYLAPPAASRDRPRPPVPVSFNGQGFGPQRPLPPPAFRPPVDPAFRYENGQPAYSNPGQVARPAAPDVFGSGRGDEPSAELEQGNDKPSAVERLRNVVWVERSKRARAAMGVAAVLAVTGVALDLKSDKSATPVMSVLGLADDNEMTFIEPDCFKPAISGSVEQQSSYILNYRNVVINKTEVDKAKQSKTYKPKTIDSFDDETGAIKMQSDAKPATPFSKEPASTERLPATLYDGEVSLNICSGDNAMSEVVHVDGSSVEIDASKLALIYDPSNPINKKATVAYEKYAPKAPGKTNPGYITDKQYTYIRKKVVPNEKDPTMNNAKFDNSIIASALSGLKDKQCLGQVNSAAQKHFETFLRQQQPDKKFTVNWKGGAFVMPDKGFVQQANLEKSVKIIDPSTKCQPFIFENPSNEG